MIERMAPSGIHHVAIKVNDLATAERFYHQVLGLRVVQRWPAAEGGGDRSIWLDPGQDTGTFIALEKIAPAPSTKSEGKAGGQDQGQDQDGADDPGHHLLVLALRIPPDARSKWEAHLAASGVEIVHRSAYTLYFFDPEGNRLGLSHYPDATENP